ncbi:MAG: hypothetical protein HC788_04885 [Sphingopyxis sp.]|nr:hypothetical protein [Sphingopyxis sp.]
MIVDRDTLNNSNAGRKVDREYIARALCAIVERHGALVTREDERHEITLTFDLQGVGALIHIDNVLAHGRRSLIHWHNTLSPARKFNTRFCRMIGQATWGGILHHKATSHPADWYSLAMVLDAGLCLAFAGEAFEPILTP